MYVPFLSAPGKWTLGALPFLLLAGCASTEAVAPAPIQAAITTPAPDPRLSALEARLEAGQRNALASAQEARALAAHQAERLRALDQQLDGQARSMDELRADIRRSAAENGQGLERLRADLQAMQQLQADSLASRERQAESGLQAIEASLDRLRADMDRLGANSQQGLERLHADLQTMQQAQKHELARQQSQAEARLQAVDSALNTRLEQLEMRLAEVGRMAEEALAALGLGPRKIYGKVVHSVTLTDDKTLFPINSPYLGEQDIAKLQSVAEYVKKLDANYHIGIHGHSDGMGSDDYNYELAKARAEVVKNHLHEKLGIPLLRMSVLSHGATDTSAYRVGANRRIVVEVLQ